MYRTTDPWYQTHPARGTRAERPLSAKLPRWLPLANRVIVLIQSLGIAFFTFHLLTVPGRKSGGLFTTPVSPFYVRSAIHLRLLPIVRGLGTRGCPARIPRPRAAASASAARGTGGRSACSGAARFSRPGT